LPPTRPRLPWWRLCSGAALCLAASGAASPALAGPGADALAAGDYKRALSILEPQARRGGAEAQYLMGRMHEQGLGAPVDLARARAWYSRAATQGYAAAHEALAALEAKPARNPTAATDAIPAGAPVSDPQRLQAMLAGRLAADRVRAASLAEAVALQAEAGEPALAVLLGEYFESGLGGTPDFPAAARWYAKAAERDHPVALNNLGAQYYDGRGVLQSFAEAERLYRRAASGGDRVAQFNLALMLGQGRNGPPDVAGMLDWLGQSAAQNYARAQAQMARFHFEGVGMPKNLLEAARNFRLAAEQGLPNAQYWIGRMTARGEGVPRDLEAAADWITRAADGGVPLAMLEAARIYEMGLGLVSDRVRALSFYRRAAEAGVAEAAERLSAVYAKGELGVTPDRKEADRWSALAKR
jgi:TPR repeat protein